MSKLVSHVIYITRQVIKDSGRPDTIVVAMRTMVGDQCVHVDTLLTCEESPQGVAAWRQHIAEVSNPAVLMAGESDGLFWEDDDE